MQNSLIPTQKGFRPPSWPLLDAVGCYTLLLYIDPKVYPPLLLQVVTKTPQRF